MAQKVPLVVGETAPLIHHQNPFIILSHVYGSPLLTENQQKLFHPFQKHMRRQYFSAMLP